MTRRSRRIAFCLAVVPLVVLIGARSAWAAYACREDGEVRAACCCPARASADHRPANGVQRMQAGCCCEVTMGDTAAAPDARADHVLVHQAPACTTQPIETASPPIIRCDEEAYGEGFARPPPRRVPIYLEHRSIQR